MRIIGGKYLNWGSEAIRRDSGWEMKMVRVKDSYKTRIQMYPGFGDADY
jgi:hypothetical protein